MSSLYQRAEATARSMLGGAPEGWLSSLEGTCFARFRVGAVADVLRALTCERDALILVHEQLAAGVLGDLADVVGDTLALGNVAGNATKKVVVVCGLGFMAEWINLQASEKTVLLLPLTGRDLPERVAADARRAMQRMFAIDTEARP